MYVVTYGDQINVPPGRLTPNPGPCIMAYQLGRDPVTELEYKANPTEIGDPSDPYGPGRAPLEAKWAQDAQAKGLKNASKVLAEFRSEIAKGEK